MGKHSSTQRDRVLESSHDKPRSSRMGDLIGSTTFQLFCAIVIGVFLPDFTKKVYENASASIFIVDETMIGTVIAILFGYLVYRKLACLPGTNALLNLLPGFLIAYLAVTTVFFALRLDFSRQQFVMSFLFVCVFFWAVTYVLNRVRAETYGLVFVGGTDTLSSIDHVNWVHFDSPKDADEFVEIPIVADMHASMSPEWERYIAEVAISGRRVFNAKHLKESLEGKVEIEHISENTFGHLAPDSIYAPLKLYIDIVVSIAALAVLWPIMLIVAIAIRLDTKGPALFRQERMGFRGKSFVAYKFRSMNIAASGKNAPVAVLDITDANDQRITRVGRFIRHTRLDELPQLLNVLKGEMSLIGPRPETLKLSQWYEDQIPFYRYRHIVRPGITGWAQVKQGHVTSVDDVRTKLRYDFYYVRHFSFWLDILIVMHTLRVMITGHGAK